MSEQQYESEVSLAEQATWPLRYFYYGLDFVLGLDFGVWLAALGPLGQVTLSCAFPLLIVGGTALFFALAKGLLRLTGERPLTGPLVCAAGLTLTGALAAISAGVFLTGEHRSVCAFVVFLIGIAPPACFGIVFAVCGRFFEFVCYEQLGSLLLPNPTGEHGPRRTSSAVSALLLVGGLILGVVLQTLTG